MKTLLSFSFASVWGKAWPIIIAILFFGLIILIHEFGHFIFAKLFKVKVNEFALGMGPTLFKIQGKETKYAVRLFPIGGFVSMEGEDEESEDEGSFSKKPVWQRMIIVIAGATFNLILGLIICCIILGTSELISTTQIYGFDENAVSSQYGLETGDKIVRIDGKRVYSSYDLSFLMQRSKDGVFDFVVERDGKKVELDGVKFATTETDGRMTIIYDFIVVGIEPSFGNVVKYSFGEAASISRIVYLSLFDLITGQYGLSDLSGPVGTVQIIAEVAQDSVKHYDFNSLLTIMALITINIGLFNLLPIPALDGGRFFFMLIELIFRKPVPAKYENLIHAAGLVLLLIFMAVVSFSDIWKLIQGKTYL
ncbi:MAG: M50 family metallopeptidase [Oscillospiraceae bacterium]|nr:M50 family metallopeptidase [Oscillospiraceae bacterium]